MLKIELNYDNKRLAVYETENEQIRVGRNSANDIHIDNLAVSGSHAIIKRVMNNYFIEDLNSTNGTFVNEKKITQYEILDGDEVIIGKHSLTFHYLRSFSRQKKCAGPNHGSRYKKNKKSC